MNKDQWIFESPEQSGLEQGAYYRLNHRREKIAVILPFELDKPISTDGNAFLVVRQFGSIEWNPIQEALSLEEAQKRGEDHVQKYARDLASQLLIEAEDYGFEMFSDEPVIEDDLDIGLEM